MSIIGSFARRSLRAHRKWTAVTVVGVIIATSMIAAVSTFSASFLDLMRREAVANNGDWHVLLSGVAASEIQTLRADGDFTALSLSRDIGYAPLDGAKDRNKPYLYVKEMDAQSLRTYGIRLLSGRLPQKAGEIVLEKAVQTDGGVDVHTGQTLTLTTGQRLQNGNDFQLNQSSPYQGKPQTYADGDTSGETFKADGTARYTVVGIIETPAFERSWSPGYTAVAFLDPAALGPAQTVNAALREAHLSRSIYSKSAALAARVGLNPKDEQAVSYNSQLLEYSGIFGGDNLESSLYIFMGVIILIILIASVSLIYNAFSISVAERTRQLGMLASVGATRAQKRRSIYLEGFYIGLIGIPLGILAGIGGIGVTLAVIRPLLASFTNFRTGGLTLVVSPASVAVAVVLAAFTILLSTLRPARRASRITPIDAIRQAQEVRLTARSVRTTKLTRKIFGFEGELALKNLKRSRRKYRTTVASLAVSLVLFLTASYYPAFTQAVRGATGDAVNFDVVASFSQKDSDTLATLKTIAAFDSVTQSACTQDNSSGIFRLTAGQVTDLFRRAVKSEADGSYSATAMLYSYDKTAFEAYAKSAGVDANGVKALENPDKPSGILIRAARQNLNGVYLAGENLGVSAGQTLQYEIPSYKKSGGTTFKTGITAGAVTDLLPIGLSREPFSQISLVLCDNVYDALNAKMPKISGNEGAYLYMRTNDAARLEKQIDGMPLQPSVYNVKQQASRDSDMNLVIEIFLFGFITLISLICIANMFNTITTNVALRRREFAMLRSVGMTPKGFGKMIRFESVFYGLKALLWGLPISFAIGLLLNKAAMGSISSGFIFPWQYYLAAVLFLLAIVTATMLYASARSRRENIVEALTGDE